MVSKTNGAGIAGTKKIGVALAGGGPVVTRNAVPISFATIAASVVLPTPPGPISATLRICWVE